MKGVRDEAMRLAMRGLDMEQIRQKIEKGVEDALEEVGEWIRQYDEHERKTSQEAA